MKVPLQVAFDGVQHSDAVEARVREEVQKLEHFHGRIVSATIVIGKPQKRHHKGDTFDVRIRLVVPDAPEIVVTREPSDTGAHEDVHVTIRDAFKAVRRQLQDATEKRAGA